MESSLSQVEDYAATISVTVDNNLAPDNIPAVYQMNSALLCIDELAVQLERLVVMCKDKLKCIVPEPTEQSADDDVVPFDWTPPPSHVYIESVYDDLYDSDSSIREEFTSD